jgi:hypothetical protein
MCVSVCPPTKCRLATATGSFFFVGMGGGGKKSSFHRYDGADSAPHPIFNLLCGQRYFWILQRSAGGHSHLKIIRELLGESFPASCRIVRFLDNSRFV